MTTYFLAVPLSENQLLTLRNDASRWALFVNREAYLDLISYKNTFYLAKRLPDFPLALDDWEKLVIHVMSLLRNTFSFSSHETLSLLSCYPRSWTKEMLY